MFDGIYFGATRTAELRNGMAVALALFAPAAALLVPAFGNHGLWLTFLIFLAGAGVILALIYRRDRALPHAVRDARCSAAPVGRRKILCAALLRGRKAVPKYHAREAVVGIE